MSSITGANAVFQLAITGLFPAPQQLQGFAADDVFTVDQLKSAETLMGVDGTLSAGFVFVPVEMNISLQADSPSTSLFDIWWSSQQTAEDLFYATGIVVLTSIGSKWNLTKGVLTGYQPLPNTKKLLQPRVHQITWQSVVPSIALAA